MHYEIVKKIQRYVLYQIFRDVGTPILEKLMQKRLKGTFHYTKVSYHHKILQKKQRFIFAFQIMPKLL